MEVYFISRQSKIEPKEYIAVHSMFTKTPQQKWALAFLQEIKNEANINELNDVTEKMHNFLYKNNDKLKFILEIVHNTLLKKI